VLLDLFVYTTLIEGSYDDRSAEMGKEAVDRQGKVLIFLYKYWKKNRNSNSGIFLQNIMVAA
jgi:hypothetical protein